MATALCVVVAATYAAMLPSAQGAASSVTVAATVLSSTTLDMSGCGASGTQFGAVTPVASVITSADCSIKFGSSNNTAALIGTQVDGVAPAMIQLGWTTANITTNGAVWLDASTAWQASNFSPNFQHTTNGGATWTTFTTGLSGSYADIAASVTNLVASGYSGRFAYSSNSGTSWTAGSAPGLTGNWLDVAAAPGGRAVAVGGSESWAYSTDYGATWTAGAGSSFSTFNDVMWLGGSTWLAVGGSNRRVMISTDDGANWSTTLSGIADGGGISSYTSVDRKPDGTLWMVGIGGRIRTSTDAGLTWVTNASLATTANLKTMTWASDVSGFITTDDAIYETTDGGATWSLAVSTPTANGSYAGMQPNGAFWTYAGSNSRKQVITASIPDFLLGTADWSTGAAGTFGMCLRSVSGAASDGGTALTADASTTGDESALLADCADGNADPWSEISPMTGTTIARQITPTTPATAIANLRFGLRIPTSQKPGLYQARVVFSVVAPG